MKVLEKNLEQWYQIVERDDGTVVLDILLPARLAVFALYEMHIPFTAEELARYREEGRSFLRWFIDRVRDDPSAYER